MKTIYVYRDGGSLSFCDDPSSAEVCDYSIQVDPATWDKFKAVRAECNAMQCAFHLLPRTETSFD